VQPRAKASRIIGGPGRARTSEKQFHRCKLHVYTNFGGGTVGIWPIVLPNHEGERHESHETQDRAATKAMSIWIKIRWTGKVWEAKAAQGPSYQTPPDWAMVLGGSTFDDLFSIAFKGRQILDLDHLVIKQMLGLD